MNDHELQCSNIQNNILKAVISKTHMRRVRKKFVIFKNIPDNNSEDDELQYVQNLLKEQVINLTQII